MCTALLTVALAAMLIGQRMAAAAVQPRSSGFVMGVNATSISDYGYNDLRPYAPASLIQADLSWMHRMGATVVRAWVAFDQISATESAPAGRSATPDDPAPGLSSKLTSP